jgi:hypothetical protein
LDIKVAVALRRKMDDTRDGAGGVRYDGQSVVLTPEGMLPLAPARFEESLEHPA